MFVAPQKQMAPLPEVQAYRIVKKAWTNYPVRVPRFKLQFGRECKIGQDLVMELRLDVLPIVLEGMAKHEMGHLAIAPIYFKHYFSLLKALDESMDLGKPTKENKIVIPDKEKQGRKLLKAYNPINALANIVCDIAIDFYQPIDDTEWKESLANWRPTDNVMVDLCRKWYIVIHDQLETIGYDHNPNMEMWTNNNTQRNPSWRVNRMAYHLLKYSRRLANAFNNNLRVPFLCEEFWTELAYYLYDMAKSQMSKNRSQERKDSKKQEKQDSPAQRGDESEGEGESEGEDDKRSDQQDEEDGDESEETDGGEKDEDEENDGDGSDTSNNDEDTGDDDEMDDNSSSDTDDDSDEEKDTIEDANEEPKPKTSAPKTMDEALRHTTRQKMEALFGDKPKDMPFDDEEMLVNTIVKEAMENGNAYDEAEGLRIIQALDPDYDEDLYYSKIAEFLQRAKIDALLRIIPQVNGSMGLTIEGLRPWRENDAPEMKQTLEKHGVFIPTVTGLAKDEQNWEAKGLRFGKKSARVAVFLDESGSMGANCNIHTELFRARTIGAAITEVARRNGCPLWMCKFSTKFLVFDDGFTKNHTEAMDFTLQECGISREGTNLEKPLERFLQERELKDANVFILTDCDFNDFQKVAPRMRSLLDEGAIVNIFGIMRHEYVSHAQEKFNRYLGKEYADRINFNIVPEMDDSTGEMIVQTLTEALEKHD